MCLLAKTPESYQPGHRHEQLLFRYDRGRAPSHTTVPAAASIYCTASRVKNLVELPRHAQWATNVPVAPACIYAAATASSETWQ